MIEAEIIKLDTQYLIGMKVITTLQEQHIAWSLWLDFFDRLAEIKNRIGENFYSLHHYGCNMFNATLKNSTPFIKYAAVQVNGSDHVPEGMEFIELQPQTYAVFRNVGYTDELRHAYNRIYQVWLAETNYQLSAAYHIEIMKPSYLNHSNAKAEEVIYVPIDVE